MCKFILNGNNAYRWTQSGDYHFIGYCFDGNRLLIEDKAIAYILENLDSARVLNGIYSLIKMNDSCVEIIVDSVNYFPIFFLFTDNQWIISDSWDCLLKEKTSFTPNKQVEAEFLNAGFVLGNDTIDKEIKKTKSGANTILQNNGTQTELSNWSYIPETFLKDSIDDLKDSTYGEFREAQSRMIEFLDGRTAVLPLSGGFDSRLIACMLKDSSYDKVVCFTYGKPNAEVNISKKVASQLGFEWHFINYQELENTAFLGTKDFDEYTKLAGNGYSMPYLQEYFAVKYLKENNIIPSDSVFLPGHSGDFLGGSYIQKTVKTNTPNDKLAPYLREKYFWFFEKKDTKTIESRLRSTHNFPDKNTVSDTYNPYIEDWDVKEKLAKFIFHSSSVFNHFGYQHYFPLWDNNLINHFRKIPFEFRENKFLYDEVLISKYFTKHGVYYNEKELIKSKSYKRYQSLKDSARSIFPWKYVLKRMTQNDWMNYSEFCESLESEIITLNNKKLKRYKAFNAVICKWYLTKLGFYNS